MISRKEVDRYIRLTTNFIKQLRKIRSPKQRKAVALSAVIDIIIGITDNSVEAVGLLEYAKRTLIMLMEDEYTLKAGAARPSEAVV